MKKRFYFTLLVLAVLLLALPGFAAKAAKGVTRRPRRSPRRPPGVVAWTPARRLSS